MAGSSAKTAVAAAFALLWGAAGHARDFEIRLNRARSVGDQLRIVASAQAIETTKSSVDGEPGAAKASRRHVRLEADVEVLAVDREGAVTKSAWTLRKFMGAVDGKLVEPIPTDGVVVAETRGAETVFQARGWTLSPKVQKLLDLVIETHVEGAPSDDEALGTRDRKKLGERWPVNKDAMIKGLAREGLTIDKDALTGTTGITRFRNVGGVSCLHIEGNVSVKGFGAPLAPGAKMVSSKLEFHMAGDYPLDTSLPPLSHKLTSQRTIQMRTPSPEGGKEMQVDVSTTSTAEQSITLTKRAGKQATRAPDVPTTGDPLRDKLARAKDQHARAAAQVWKSLFDLIDARIKELADKGDLASAEALTRHKEKVRPVAPLPAEIKDPTIRRAKLRADAVATKANRDLVSAYERAVRECMRAGSIAKAEALLAEMRALDLPGGCGGQSPAEGFVHLGKGRRFPSYLARPRGVVLGRTGLGAKGNFYVRTRSGRFLTEDFVFEVVFSFARGRNSIAFVGMGAGTGDRHHGEPWAAVNLRIHTPGRFEGGIGLTNAGPSAWKGMGRISDVGPHRVRIEKAGSAVLFAIDVHNDGPSPDDFSRIIPDIKTFAPFLKGHNTHLFFGCGAVFHMVRLVRLR